MHIEAPVALVGKSREDVYAFLTNLENFEQLMPDNIQTFEVLDENTFRFALKGMPEIVLRRKEQQPHDWVVLGAASDKLPFTLRADLEEGEENKTGVKLSFEGDFNPMMAMMIKGPITNFLGTLSEKLGSL